jgi:hypothetical protein
MAIVAGFDVHRRQITFDALDTETGEISRGRIDATPAAVKAWSKRFEGEVKVAVRREHLDRRGDQFRIARAVERPAAHIGRAEPEAVALHLEAAGEPGRGLSYRLEAGRLALGRSANVEAVAQLTRGIADLGARADSESRADLELDIRVLLGNALISVRGYASPVVEDCYARARALGDHRGRRALAARPLRAVGERVRARVLRARPRAAGARRAARPRGAHRRRARGWPLGCMGRLRRRGELFWQRRRNARDRLPAPRT